MLIVWSKTKQFLIKFWLGLRQIRSLSRPQIPRILDTFSWPERSIIISALILFLISGGFLLSEVFGSHGPGPHYGGEISEGLVGQPQFINPILSLTNTVDTDISRIVYAQLLKYDDNQILSPDLAESLPQIAEDQKTYTLNLRPNLKWQDGKPLTSDDVLFTITLIQNPDFESPLRPNWSRVKVSKTDDLTLVFTLREISASFINNFAIGILPKHIWDGLSPRNFRLSENNLKPIGSGPFSVSEIKQTVDGTVKTLTLNANNNYYLGRPYLNEVTFKFFNDYDGLISAYQGREITSLGFMALNDKTFIATSDKYNQFQISLPQYQAVFFNLQKNTPLLEKGVRQALWLTTNRQTIIDQVYSGQAVPAYTPILPEEIGYDAAIEKTIHESVDEANKILDEAGWVMNSDTHVRKKKDQTLEFNLAVNGNLALNVKTAQALQEQWSRVGAKVDLTIVSSSDLEQNYIRPRNFEALLFSENIGSDPDPFPFWSSTQVHDPGLNFSGFNNSQADKLLSEARKTTDVAVRTQDYIAFQEIINDQLPAIFLVRSLYIYNVPKKIQGINLAHIIHPSERFLDINKWFEQN